MVQCVCWEILTAGLMLFPTIIVIRLFENGERSSFHLHVTTEWQHVNTCITGYTKNLGTYMYVHI